MNKFSYQIDKKHQGLSVRDVLLFFSLGKDKIYYYNLQKAIYLDGENVNDQHLVNEGQFLEIKLEENINYPPLLNDLEVVFEDQYFLIVNKPRNILVHSDGNDTLTLSNAVASYYKKHRIRRNIRVCNRLDFETSGLVIFAKDPISESAMNALIRERKIEKRYYAICLNKFSKKEGQINLPIGRDRHDSQKMRISKTGKEALTTYKVLKGNKISLVDINLHTGRTHQIRVHFAFINHPLIGDGLYGKKNNEELCLQAYFLKFKHPFTKREQIIKIDLDKKLEKMLGGDNVLRGK